MEVTTRSQMLNAVSRTEAAINFLCAYMDFADIDADATLLPRGRQVQEMRAYTNRGYRFINSYLQSENGGQAEPITCAADAITHFYEECSLFEKAVDYCIDADDTTGARSILKKTHTAKLEEAVRDSKFKIFKPCLLVIKPHRLRLSDWLEEYHGNTGKSTEGKETANSAVLETERNTGAREKWTTEEAKLAMTKTEKEYYQKAINSGLMKETERGYKWEYGGKQGRVRLAYFLNMIFQGVCSISPPWGRLEALFELEKSGLRQSYDQFTKGKTWEAEIKKLFPKGTKMYTKDIGDKVVAV